MQSWGVGWGGGGWESLPHAPHCSHGRSPPCSWAMQGSLGAADSPWVLLMSLKAEAAQHFGDMLSSSQDWVQSSHHFCLQTQGGKR